MLTSFLQPSLRLDFKSALGPAHLAFRWDTRVSGCEGHYSHLSSGRPGPELAVEKHALFGLPGRPH